jgi:hypothetical protein
MLSTRNSIKEEIYKLGIGKISSFLKHFLQEICGLISNIILNIFFQLGIPYA